MKRSSRAAVIAAVVAVPALGAGVSAVAAAPHPASADSEVVTVGAILSESGIYSTLGPPERQAMTMGLEALNATGFDVGGPTTRWTSPSPTTSRTRPPPA